MSGIETRLRGRWRITEASQWDRDDLDRVEPAFITFGEPGAEDAFAFGVVTASLDCAYSQTDVGFDWDGSDEGMGGSGTGWGRAGRPLRA